MKKSNALLCLVLFLFFFSFSLHAQKVGYIDYQEILSQMPETESVKTNIDFLKKQLHKKELSLIENCKKAEEKFIKNKEKGKFSKTEEEDEFEKVENCKADLLTFQKRMKEDIQEKEEQSMIPISKKLNETIKEIAEKHKYAFVIDSETDEILYSSKVADKDEINRYDTDNVTLEKHLMKKLGLYK